MNPMLKKLIVVLCFAAAPIALLAQNPGRALDPADIMKPLADEWRSYSGDLSGKRYSALKLVNTNTVKNLSLKWITPLMTGCGPDGRGAAAAAGAAPAGGGGG